MCKMYIKAIVKEVKDSDNKSNSKLVVKLEGIEKFILKTEKYEKERKLVNNNGNKDMNIFIKDVDKSSIFDLMRVDEEFNVEDKLEDLLKKIFISQKPYIFGIDYSNNKIISIRKCDD